jgi:predicted permease|eukprot:COSAG06_NODE_2421_length_6903_cov_3.511905_2_plen_460_part_00
MADVGGSSSGGGGGSAASTNQMVLDNLLPAILQTFALVLLGAASNYYSLIPPTAGDTLGAYTAKFALPALIFRQMAVLNLGDCSIMLLVGMLISKLAVAILVAVITCCLSSRVSRGRRERSWSMAAIFAMLTTMQNDFALGLPILNALYDEDDAATAASGAPTQLKKSDYLYLFAPISVLIINPLCFAVLELANALARRKNSSGTPQDQIGCWFLCRQVLLPTISNPVVFCVGLGLLANLAKIGDSIPKAVDGALVTLGASFSSLALFCLGMSMADSKGGDSDGGAPGDDDSDTDGEESAAARLPQPPIRTARFSIGDIRAGAGVRSAERGIGSGRWMAAVLLVVAKSLLLPIVARSVVLLLTEGEEDSYELSRFAFVYATFPAAPSVYLFAARFNLRARDLAHVSLTTLLGTLLAAPIMFVTAQMALIDLDSETSDHFTAVLQAAEQIGFGSMVFSGW